MSGELVILTVFVNLGRREQRPREEAIIALQLPQSVLEVVRSEHGKLGVNTPTVDHNLVVIDFHVFFNDGLTPRLIVALRLTGQTVIRVIIRNNGGSGSSCVERMIRTIERVDIVEVDICVDRA